MNNKKNTITLNLDDIIDLNINIVESNGKPAVQFRKTISACDKNINYVRQILKEALENDSEIIMPVRLQIFNKPLAKGKLIQTGILKD